MKRGRLLATRLNPDFSGLTIHRPGKQRLRMYLAMKTKDGYREEALSYERVHAGR